MTIAMERDFGGTDAADLGTPDNVVSMRDGGANEVSSACWPRLPALAQRDDRDRLVGTSGPTKYGLQPRMVVAVRYRLLG